MKRTTITWPEATAAAVEREARQRGVAVSTVVRESVEQHVIALAERMGAEVDITLDRRHFGAVRPRHCESFRLLPA